MLMATVALSSVSFAKVAFAQSAPAADEKVTVTGSRIRRSPANSPTPLVQVTRDQIVNSGQQNVIDYLADIPALQLSVTPEDTTGTAIGQVGVSVLNLRALGSDRTLVLVDGRRHVGVANGSTAVDVDTIPRLLIQNVEVVTGGSSAVYGADAVSGAVNFVLRKNIQGFEFDGALAEINQDGQTGARASGLYGTSLFDDKLNVYVSAEYEQSERVRDLDIDWQREGRSLVTRDADPTTSPALINDGIFDVQYVKNVRSLNRPTGGALVLANLVPQSATGVGSPLIPAQGPCSLSTTTVVTACFQRNPGKVFVFDAAGNGRLASYGQGPATLASGDLVTNIGGDGDPLAANNVDRLPYLEATRFQTGFTYDLFDSLTVYGEAKYVKESGDYEFQPAFFNVLIAPRPAGSTTPTFTDFTSLVVGTDNAYLPANVLAAINANTYTNFGAATATANGAPLATPTAPQRALFRFFATDLGGRPAFNERELERFVGGFKGDLGDFGIFTDINYDVSWTYGRVMDVDKQSKTVDIERFAFSIDAVRDTAGVLGTPNAIVCRVRLNAALGQPLPLNQATGVNYLPTDPAITQCRPSNMFGVGGIAPNAGYILTELDTANDTKQKDVSGYLNFNVGDYWSAGDISVVVGGEWRREEYAYNASSPDPDYANKFVFGNELANTPRSSYEVKEAFAEVNIPILRNTHFADLLEVGGAYRSSQYTSIAHNNTLSLRAFYRPSPDIAFRATYGEAVRAPDLGDLFSPLSQTFVNLNDPCSTQAQIAQTNATILANWQATCALAIWGNTLVGNGPLVQVAGGVFSDPNPTVSNFGRSGGNPFLKEEESYSYTYSAILTPRFIPGFTAVADYYDIEISQAIATVGAAQLLRNCADQGPNAAACSLFARDPVTFEIVDFIEGANNFALIRTRGIDYNIGYRFDMSDVYEEWLGSVNLSLRGNYLIRRQNYTNPANLSQATELDSTAEYPRVRFATGATYSLPDFSFSWTTDWIGPQEIQDRKGLVANGNLDNRAKGFADTPWFIEHGFTVQWEALDGIGLRAGVINAFDAEPSVQGNATSGGSNDIGDFYGRRFFMGVNVKMD